MEKFIQERLQIFLNKMAGFATSENEFNLGKWGHFFAFDVIGELVCPRVCSKVICQMRLMGFLCSGI
jgi:hypothetical protein